MTYLDILYINTMLLVYFIGGLPLAGKELLFSLLAPGDVIQSTLLKYFHKIKGNIKASLN
jgi:hypothetical protein